MKLSLISEADITKPGIAGKAGREVGKAALGIAADLVPGGGIAASNPHRGLYATNINS